MKYKIIISGHEAEIEESEIKNALQLIAAGGIVVLKHVIFNSAYFQAIVPDFNASRQSAMNSSYGFKTKQESEFAKILSPKFAMLSSQQRTKSQEEAARLERRSRNT